MDEAERMAESAILDAIDENLPEDVEDEREWNWGALATMANTRFGLNLRDRDLKKQGRDLKWTSFFEKAREALQKVDLSDGQTFLEATLGSRPPCAWVRHKFGLDIPMEEVEGLDPRGVDGPGGGARDRGLRR